MKISVVTPSLNQGRFLAATIKSVLSQDHGDVDYLVIDGGSADHSIELLRDHSDSRLAWISEPDHGQTDAVNKGFRRASGEVLAYLNADDLYEPGTLTFVARYFADHPECDILYGRAAMVAEDGSYLREYPTRPWDYEFLQVTCFLCQPAVFWRRRVMDRFGVFDERLHYAMDYEYWLRVGAVIPFHYSYSPVLARSREYPTNKTLGQRVRAHEEILDVVCRYATSLSPVHRWLRVLAHLRADEDRSLMGHGEEFNARYRRVYVTWLLLYAEQYEIPLDNQILSELQ